LIFDFRFSIEEATFEPPGSIGVPHDEAIRHDRP
jgi:hypothetical protein